MRSAAKKYNTVYKKKIDVHHDTFLPRRSPKETIQCRGCGAYARFRLISASQVRCRKCDHEWRLIPPGPSD